ncbi:MAG TPA: ATP-binding cassette domain-containing protein [Nocardioides sp.]|nr:ATP-binding cassette domain-containing protein [Nocardioides sp.]
MTVVAELVGVSKSYGRKRALAPTDLTLSTGVIGLLGPNGAGKTTLLRLLATAQPPTTGQITVAGHDVTGSLRERTRARRLLGYLPQEVGFPSRTTAFGFLDYIGVLKEWSDTPARHAEVQRVLDLVHLGTLGRSRVSALSGGQRRRLAIAQAFIGDPRLVVLDEPTTGLDPEQRASLRGLLSEQARTSVVLLATHQTEDVSALCDRVIVLDDGVVCFDGTVPELIATARGQVWVGADANVGALSSWRTGSGAVRSVGGTPRHDSRAVEPAVEDAYLLMRATTPTRSASQGVLP